MPRAGPALALEFYANARFMGKKYVSYVRGKEIDYSPKRINDLLEIIPPEECDVQRRMAECKDWSDDKRDELKAQLCVDGAKWRGGSHMLLRADFKPVPNNWASFVVQTLEGTTCTSEIPLPRLHTIAAILDGAPINVSELIRNNIYMFTSGLKKDVPHLSMICWFCEEAECDHFANDLSAPMMKPLNDTYMDTFVKDYHWRGEAAAADQPQPQPQPQYQPPPPQGQTFIGEGSSQQGTYAPIHPMQLDYMFGHCN